MACNPKAFFTLLRCHFCSSDRGTMAVCPICLCTAEGQLFTWQCGHSCHLACALGLHTWPCPVCRHAAEHDLQCLTSLGFDSGDQARAGNVDVEQHLSTVCPRTIVPLCCHQSLRSLQSLHITSTSVCSPGWTLLKS
jgi:hypothetical protein